MTIRVLLLTKWTKMAASMDDVVNVHEAKTHLSRLLARVEAGEEITLARGGKPIARIVPIAERRLAPPGAHAHLFDGLPDDAFLGPSWLPEDDEEFQRKWAEWLAPPPDGANDEDDGAPA